LERGELYENTYNYWDVDESGYLDEVEFGLGLDESSIYDSLNVDNDGLLNQNEYGYQFETESPTDLTFVASS